MCIRDSPLKFNPGTRWNYGLSTDIVGRLVEILAGARFDEYLRGAIFEPLGMEDTGFFVPEGAAHRLAALYQFQPGNTPSLLEAPEQSRYLHPPSYLSGAGGLVSTTSDYVAFCQMLANGGQLGGRRILGRKTLELMTRNHLCLLYTSRGACCAPFPVSGTNWWPMPLPTDRPRRRRCDCIRWLGSTRYGVGANREMGGQRWEWT